MGQILALCLSSRRGTAKTPVDSVKLIAGHGLEGDAHAGDWHRQVSLLSAEKIDAFRSRGAEVTAGSFGENIVAAGFDFSRLPVGSLLRSGDALLEITQIGKECHQHCAIYHAVGDCIMPREGTFARVLRGGTLRTGDALTRVYRTAVITLSDKASCAEREDKSGPAICTCLEADGRFQVVRQLLLPDEPEQLTEQLIALADRDQMDLIVTTGGTGFAPRDCTPEATMAAAERMAPGIAEAIRLESLKITPRAMLSRGVSVIRGGTLIVNLPGSPKACRESLHVCLDVLPHGLDLLRGQADECAR